MFALVKKVAIKGRLLRFSKPHADEIRKMCNLTEPVCPNIHFQISRFLHCFSTMLVHIHPQCFSPLFVFRSFVIKRGKTLKRFITTGSGTPLSSICNALSFCWSVKLFRVLVRIRDLALIGTMQEVRVVVGNDLAACADDEARYGASMLVGELTTSVGGGGEVCKAIQKTSKVRRESC